MQTSDIQARLERLKEEFQSGQQMLQELQSKQVHLEQSMLRISGAVQVLEELLEAQGVPAPAPETES